MARTITTIEVAIGQWDDRENLTYHPVNEGAEFNGTLGIQIDYYGRRSSSPYFRTNSPRYPYRVDSDDTASPAITCTTSTMWEHPLFFVLRKPLRKGGN